MARGLYVPADVNQPIEVRDFTALEDYQAAVEGWIEPVDVPDLGITIYVNEEGLLRHLPLNSRVTFTWWYHVPAARQRALLVGNAVVVGWSNRVGASTDVPDKVEALLQLQARFGIETRSIGGHEWKRGERTYDYVDATVWAMLAIERSEEQLEVRIVPVS